MAVEVELFGQLLPDQPRQRTIEIKGPSRVCDLACVIGLDTAEIGLIAIDGVQSELDDFVGPDSRLCFFPYVSGG